MGRKEKVIFRMMVLTFAVLTVLIGRLVLLQSNELRNINMIQEHVRELRDVSSDPCETEKNIMEEKKRILPEYQELVKQNPDLAGWIYIEGTNIDYPVMQTPEDPEYYIHRDFLEKKSYAGMIFVGNGNMQSETGLLFLYGHNMKNGSMFSDLLNYQEQDYWEKKPIVLLDTLREHRKYRIFSAFYATEDDWSSPYGIFYAVSETGNQNLGAKIKKLSIYETGVEPKKADSLLILVTCSYHKKEGRFVVAGTWE